MRIPTDLYGTAEAVNVSGKRWARHRLHDGAWTGSDDRPAHLDTADRPGLILLDPGDPWPGERAWHCYLPAMVVTMAIATEDVSPQTEEDTFTAWLDEPWSVLGLLSPVNVAWLHQPHRFRPLLRAVVDAWPDIQAEGARYSVGAPDGQDLWSVPTNLGYMLANMGLSSACLSRPLPPGGLPELLDHVAGWDGRPTRERWG